jgi:hypothetical protein
MASSKEAG